MRVAPRPPPAKRVAATPLSALFLKIIIIIIIIN
jgi:hypothetical protein